MNACKPGTQCGTPTAAEHVDQHRQAARGRSRQQKRAEEAPERSTPPLSLTWGGAELGQRRHQLPGKVRVPLVQRGANGQRCRHVLELEGRLGDGTHHLADVLQAWVHGHRRSAGRPSCASGICLGPQLSGNRRCCAWPGATRHCSNACTAPTGGVSPPCSGWSWQCRQAGPPAPPRSACAACG